MIDHHLQLIAGGEHLRLRRPVRLGREGDPGKGPRELADTTGFQVERHIDWLQRCAQGREVVLQRLAAGDHHKGSAGRGRLLRFLGQSLQR